MVIRAVPYGPASEAALGELIEEAKRDDPVAPVTVAVPSNYAGLALRRSLAASSLPAGGQRGLVNVRFMVLPRVVELIGAARLADAGRRPLTTPYRAEAVRAAVAANPGPFTGISLLGSTERSLGATFRDLAGASDRTLAALAALNRRSAHIVALYRDFRDRTAAFYDEHDLVLAATESISDGSAALADIGRLIIYLPRTLSGTERAFVAALARRGRVDVVLGLTGDRNVDSPALDVWRKVSPLEEEAHPEGPPAGTAVVAVPDAEEEAREVVRQIVHLLLAGIPLYRMAVVYPHAAPYEQLVAEQLEAANLPWNGPSPRRLGQTLAGRTLLGFLQLHEDDFEREAVTAWLTAAPLLDGEGGRPVPACHWERIARAAGVIGGADGWHQRLAQHARSLVRERRRLEGEDEGREWRLRRIEQDLTELQRLRPFIDELVTRARPQGQARWSEFAAWARSALRRYLGGEGHTARWPEEEVAAYREVLDALDQLAALDEVRETVDVATFRSALEHLLDRPAGRFGRFGDGVFVGHLSDATGLSFEAIFILGMNEGSIPSRQREDPLLTDDERRQAGIEPRAFHSLRERRDYLAALASAPRRTLVFARGDVRGQRARLPSRWLLETASVLAGEHVYASEIEHYTDRPWFRDVPSFEWAIGQADTPAQPQEYDLRSLLRWRARGRPVGGHYLARAEQALGDGFALQLARRSRAFTRWDGRIPAAEKHSPFGGRLLSPSALQTWATCPFHYFLGYLLRVAEMDRPERELRISPLEKGALVHRALERFFGEMPQRTKPEQPWTAEERRRLHEIGEEECDFAERSGLTGHRLFWELERRRILRDLDRFLDEDEALRQRLGTVTVAAELGFGMEGENAITIETAPGRSLRLRGRIDRVDCAPDGSRLAVIDYKTGTPRGGFKKLEADPVQGGALLQLPVYAEAARRRYGIEEVSAFYWFVTEGESFRTYGYVLDADRSARFVSVLDTIGSGIAGGIFLLRPGPPGQDWPEHCRFCPYQTLCPVDRVTVWSRKCRDAEIAPYLGLFEPEVSS